MQKCLGKTFLRSFIHESNDMQIIFTLKRFVNTGERNHCSADSHKVFIKVYAGVFKILGICSMAFELFEWAYNNINHSRIILISRKRSS